jgi:hypothetical protein
MQGPPSTSDFEFALSCLLQLLFFWLAVNCGPIALVHMPFFGYGLFAGLTLYLSAGWLCFCCCIFSGFGIICRIDVLPPAAVSFFEYPFDGDRCCTFIYPFEYIENFFMWKKKEDLKTFLEFIFLISFTK